MPEIVTRDATLNVEIDGEGEPVTVFAHVAYGIALGLLVGPR